MVFSLPLKQIIPVTADSTMIRTPRPATIIVGNDLSFAYTLSVADTVSAGSSMSYAFNRTDEGPTHDPLLASGLRPFPQSAQVPNHVII